MYTYLGWHCESLTQRHQYLSEKNTQLKHTTASLLMKSKRMHYNEYLIPKKGKFVDSSLPKCEGRI